jgi:hypothetical protein
MRLKIFDAILDDIVIDSVVHPNRPDQLRLHVWDGCRTRTVSSVEHQANTYKPSSIATGLTRAVRFPTSSRDFGTTTKVTESMSAFLSKHGHLTTDVAALLVAFALGSWFSDCFPISPVLHLLGPENEVCILLRLLGNLCRRPVLIGDVDVGALATFPKDLYSTLLINQRRLSPSVRRVLLASSASQFCIARGHRQLHINGAKAFSADSESANGIGLRVSISPVHELIPTLSDQREKQNANYFQSQLLRYRMIYLRRVFETEIDTRQSVPSMREEVRAWLTPIVECPDLRDSVFASLLQKSHDLEGNSFCDERCLAAEAALFFCHTPNRDHFFVADLTDTINSLLTGRHEDRQLTDKKAGLLLRELGIYGRRVAKGYKILLTDSIRQKIHQLAYAYAVVSTKDSEVRCHYCRGFGAH